MPPYLFQSSQIMRQQGIENRFSETLGSSLLLVTRKISKVSLVSSFINSNLFRREFTLRYLSKAFLGCLFLNPSMVLKVSFISVEFNFFLLASLNILSLFTLTCVLCKQPNLLKANTRFLKDRFVPFSFKYLFYLEHVYSMAHSTNIRAQPHIKIILQLLGELGSLVDTQVSWITETIVSQGQVCLEFRY